MQICRLIYASFIWKLHMARTLVKSTVKPRYISTNRGKMEFWPYNKFGDRSRSGFLSATCWHSKTCMRYWWEKAFSWDLTIPHLDLSHFALWIMGSLWYLVSPVQFSRSCSDRIIVKICRERERERGIKTERHANGFTLLIIKLH